MDYKEQYFQYLKSLVGEVWEGKSYSILLRLLFQSEFYWLVDMDENRAMDGKNLRWEFARSFSKEERDLISEELEGPARDLEVIIGVAKRMDDDLWNGENRERIWFWELISNLNLAKFYNVCENFPVSICKFFHQMKKWHDRDFGKNGEGSLFPCKNFSKNGKNAEIWLQMRTYLNNNYPLH